MILDFVNSANGPRYILRVPRSAPDIKAYVTEHGLNFSTSASTTDEAVLFTDNMYAAMTYAEHATPAAMAQFGPLLPELEASRCLGMPDRKCKVPDGLDLYPFQKAGVDYVLRRNRALIGDSPGLGKTPMGVVTANEMGAKRVLVVCPANIRLQWAKQIRTWSTMEGRFIVYPILKSADGVHPGAHWTIVSYDLLRSPGIRAALSEKHFDLVVLDECHYLKTSSAARTQAVFGDDGIAHNAGHVLGLTGTPLPNRPRECFTLAKALCWDAIDFMDEDAFQARFNPMAVKKGRGGGKYVEEKKGRHFELQHRLRCNFMIRRRKRDVLDQLPDIDYEINYVEETGAIRKALAAEKMLDIDPEDLRGVSAQEMGHISTVRKMMGVAKAPLAADYVNMLLEGGEEKLVVFGWHLEVLDIMQEKLQKWGVVRVDGSTSTVRRQMAVDSFVENEVPRVFLGNLQSIGVGVDGLQKVCNRGIFAECSWTPADNDQGVGRLERIGQKYGILIEFLVAPGSFDERVLGTSLRKLRDIHTALDERA